MSLSNILEETQHIVAVDDEVMNCLLIEDIIEQRYQLVTLNSGAELFQYLEEHLPDLILLDINMPEMDGFEVLFKLKSNPATVSIPVIFLTAMLGVDDERTGLEMGAVDYITKPFSESILLARIQTHLALNNARKIIEKSNLHLQNERNHLQQIIQKMREDDRYQTLNLQQLVSPVEESNGDIILSATNQSNHHYILIGDFTGHGLNAAMAGPLVSSLFYNQAVSATTSMEILAMVNDELFRKLPTQSFLAAIFIDWDKPNQLVTVWNFAMPDAVLIKAGGECQKIPSMSVPLGILSCEKHSPLPQTLAFEEGDTLFAYSDGIVEVSNPQGDLFGEQRLKPLLKEVVANHQPLEEVYNAVNEFAEGCKIHDDITLIQLTAHYTNGE